MVGDAHALGQDDAEAIEQKRPGRRRAGRRSAAGSRRALRWAERRRAIGCGEFLEHGARGVAKAGALLPHLEALPQHEGEEADQDVGLHAIGALMPDRSHAQLILLDAEGGLGLGELDVGLPELLVAPVVDVGAQQIGAFGECGPMVESGVVIDVQAKAGRTSGGLQR